MNFVNLIKNQKAKLSSFNYVKSLWDEINNGYFDINLEGEEVVYKLHLPVDLPQFLAQCADLLRQLLERNSEPEWKNVDLKYFNSLLYYLLKKDSEDLTTYIEQLYAADIYCLMCSLSPNSFSVVFYDSIFMKILYFLKHENSKYRDIEIANWILFMNDLKLFSRVALLNMENTKSLVTIIFDLILREQSMTLKNYDDFPIDTQLSNTGQEGFILLRVIALRATEHYTEKLLFIVLTLANAFKESIGNDFGIHILTTLQSNVNVLIKQLMPVLSTERHCIITDMLRLISRSPDYNSYDAMVQLLSELSSEKRLAFAMWLVEAIISNDNHLRMHAQNLVIPVLSNISELQTAEKHETVAELLVNNLLMLIVDSNDTVQENAVKNFQQILQSNNNTIQFIIKKIMNRTVGNVNRRTIIMALQKATDMQWKRKQLNKNYICVICKLLQLKPKLLTPKSLKHFETVCKSASPFDLKPCAQQLVNVLKLFAVHYPIITKTILNIFIHQMEHPMATSSYYIKELHAIIFNNITSCQNNDCEYAIINVLISSDFDYYQVFNKFNTLSLLQPQTLKNVMAHHILKHGAAWKLLCIILQFVPYKEIHTLDNIILNLLIHKILSPNTSYALYVFNQILKSCKQSSCDGRTIGNLKAIQDRLFEMLIDKLIPPECITNAIGLMDTLAKFNHYKINWAGALFEELEKILGKKLQAIVDRKLHSAWIIERDTKSIEELLMVTNHRLSLPNEELLKKIVQSADGVLQGQDNYQTYGLCILLYSKNCFRVPALIDECITTMQIYLNVDNDHIKICALTALYDICNYRLQYYEPLIPNLFTFINDRNPFLRFKACELIAMLIKGDHLRLIEIQYLLFVTLITDENKKIKVFIRKVLKEIILEKNEQIVAGYFVSCIIHYNHFNQHPTIFLTSDDQDLLKQTDYTKEKRMEIYTFLFTNLSKCFQFHVVDQIVEEILRMHCVPDVFEIFQDSMALILLMKSKDFDSKDLNKFYENQLMKIRTKLLIPTGLPDNEASALPYKQTLKKLMMSLLKLLYSTLMINHKIVQEVFHVIIVCSNEFHSELLQILKDGCNELEIAYGLLEGFYNTNKHYIITEDCGNLENYAESDSEDGSLNNKYSNSEVNDSPTPFPIREYDYNFII